MQRNEVHIHFYDTIGYGDWFYGTTLQDVRYQVEGYAAFDSTEPALPEAVYLHFPACQGGDVVEGYAIYNYIRGLAAKGVKTVARIEGLCASIAVLCAIACDTVEMADAALLMVHKPTSDGWNLNADDMRAGADLLDKIQAQLVSRYVARCGMDVITANELINRTTWMGADEAIGFGFVNSKIPDAPIVAPADAAGVLNYYPKSKPVAPMALSEKDEKGLFAKFGNFLKEEFGLKTKNEVAAEAAAVATNASSEVDGGDTMYYDGTLAADTAVYSDEAMTMAYADGTYTLADGQSVTVAAGLVTALAPATENMAPETPATNSGDLSAANATIAELEAKLTTANQTVTGLKNKLAKVVPGSPGTPNSPGAVQNLITAPGAAATATPNSLITIRRS